MISGIGADRDRNAQSRQLGHLLQRVVLSRERARITAQSGDEAVDADVANELTRRGEIVGRPRAHHSHRAPAARGAVHHHAGFFLESHAAHEILGAR